MKEIEDNSVHLIITSPPYNVGREYEKERLRLKDYLSLLKSVFEECNRVLVNGGRLCMNISNIKRRPHTPYTMYVTKMLLEMNFLMRGTIVWYKKYGCNLSTRWGSWMSANNPFLRDQHEFILVFSKNQLSRNEKNKKSTITRNEFMEYTKSVWTFSGINNKNHPAVFPIELPNRLIKLYSFENDAILDPFCGIGTTLISALRLKRNAIGYDINKKYIDVAKKSVSQIGSIEKWLYGH